MKKMMLISPHPPGRHGEESITVIVQMPLGLAYLSALTPGNDWEFDIIDENMELALNESETDITFEPVDLVCLTALTFQAARAYKIAAACKKRGITVIMGGLHASVQTEEAMEHVDSVVTGEAEIIWVTVIKDFEEGKLKKRYDGGLPDLSVLKNVYPDRDLLKRKYDYKFSSIITTKGCPNHCDFCSVPTFQGGKFRERPVEDVIDEMLATDYKGLMFAEDNFYGHGKRSNERANKLFKLMVEKKTDKDWLGFTALNISQDADTLEYMAKSGNFGMLIGIESTNEDVLAKMGKNVNLKLGVDSYFDCVDKIHQAGLVVWGSMVFGADGDKKDSFERMADFVLDNNIDILTYGINTPFPMTPLFKRLDSEQRIFRKNFPNDWKYYDTANVCHRFVDLTLEEFIEGMQLVYDMVYAGSMLRERFRNTINRTHNPRNAMFAFKVGCDWKQVFEQVLDHLKELYDSGDYYRDWYKSSSVIVNKELDNVTTTY
ncbi:MAG: B12-binding domain-containing radical SAM protein [Candidatus Anammoxibacter sp.]